MGRRRFYFCRDRIGRVGEAGEPLLLKGVVAAGKG